MLSLNKYHKPWGKIAMIRRLDGERYYWFVDKDGDVSMMPECAVDFARQKRAKRAPIQKRTP